MIQRLGAWISNLIYKISEWIGGCASYVIYQLGIPVESSFLEINPVLSSFVHGFISMVIPVGSFYLIHVFKRLIEDKESWAGKANEWVVLTISLKRKVVSKDDKSIT